jgi:SAM-dependent methyltransferase
MNEHHARVCPSPEWAEQLQSEILPWVTRDVDLGSVMLEVGPGPGAATDWLRQRVHRLVTVETEQEAAEKLRIRFAGTNVDVVHADATALRYDAASFDSVGCFTMLHHVPTVAAQNRLLAEVFRVLRPGATLVGSDSLGTDELHAFHENDTYNPVEPAAFLVRLQTLGFGQLALRVDGRRVLFAATKPSTED